MDIPQGLLAAAFSFVFATIGLQRPPTKLPSEPSSRRQAPTRNRGPSRAQAPHCDSVLDGIRTGRRAVPKADRVVVASSH